MTTKAADDYESIARYLKELEADKDEALTGSSAPVKGQDQKPEMPYGYMTDYCGLASLAHPAWPYTGTAHEWRGFVKVS